MQYCPPFPTNFDVYFRVLDAISCATPFINGFTIICILKKSSKQMSGYCYHLLIHQLFASLVDILVSILTKPILLLPLPIGYPTGLISQYTSFPSHYQLVLALETIIISLVTALQLFFYRFIVASGRMSFSLSQILLILFVYALFSIPAMIFLFNYEDQTKLLKSLGKNYSCISQDILRIPNLQAYSAPMVIYSFSIPMLCACVLFIVVAIGLIVTTYRMLKRSSISKRAAYMQRKFLQHLILQMTIPITVVIIPAAAILIVICFQIFGTAMLSLFMLAAISTYGASGAIVLIYLTPSYRRALMFWEHNPVKTISTVTWSRAP